VRTWNLTSPPPAWQELNPFPLLLPSSLSFLTWSVGPIFYLVRPIPITSHDLWRAAYLFPWLWEAVGASETSVNFNETIRCYLPEGYYLKPNKTQKHKNNNRERQNLRATARRVFKLFTCIQGYRPTQEKKIQLPGLNRASHARYNQI
jgi:hypothetical protein